MAAVGQPKGDRGSNGEIPETYDAAILKEIWMISDFITGLPNMTVENLEIVNPQPGNPPLKIAQVLKSLNEIDAKVEKKDQLNPEERVLLQLIRDKLNSLIKPASGLSVAYTSMVVGNRRGHYPYARAELAKKAYSGLALTAQLHRWGQRALLVLALFMTTSAVWESAKVALGKSLLNNIQQLYEQRDRNAAEKMRLENGTAVSASLWGTPKLKLTDGVEAQFDICDRPAILSQYYQDKLIPIGAQWPHRKDQSGKDGPGLLAYETPSQHEFCERDRILAENFRLAHTDLEQFHQYWPSMVGSFFTTLAEFGGTLLRLAHSVIQVFCKSCANPAGMGLQTGYGQGLELVNKDVELIITPVLLVLGNYVLPVIFALLGASAFVVLDFYSKVRASLLTPPDHILSWIRLVLGLVIGACIGLFYSSYGPQQQSGAKDLIASLTLSASGLAFLAGFGVEAVFSLLSGLVKRVFETGQAPP